VLVDFQLIISEPTGALSNINSLF